MLIDPTDPFDLRPPTGARFYQMMLPAIQNEIIKCVNQLERQKDPQNVWRC